MPGRQAIAQAESRAIPVLDAWMKAFNAMDLEARKKTMHFPHYRLASGEMRVLDDEDMDEAHGARDKANFKAMGWHRSGWDRRNIIHCSDEKIHVDTQFTRYREDGSVIASHDSLYILTFENGRWGIKMRSSYAK